MKKWRPYVIASAVVTVLAVVIYWQGEKCDANANECISKLAVSGEANKSASPNEAIQSCRESQGYLCRILAPANIPNIFLVLIGLGGIIVAIGSLDILERQTSAVNRNIEISISKERARVRIEDVEFVPAGGALPMAEGRFKVRCYGNSPAYIIEGYSDIYGTKATTSPIEEPRIPMSLPKVINPNVEPVAQTTPAFDSVELALGSGVGKASCFIYFRGQVLYADCFDKKWLVESNYVWKVTRYDDPDILGFSWQKIREDDEEREADK